MWNNSRNSIWNPWHEFMNLDNAFKPFFDNFHGNADFPPTNVWTGDDKIVFAFEIPGMKAENIDVAAKADTLTVKGERSLEDAPEGAQILRQERGAGFFSRSFALPFKVDHDKIEASYVNGVLTVVLPKAPEVQPRKISIHTAE